MKRIIFINWDRMKQETKAASYGKPLIVACLIFVLVAWGANFYMAGKLELNAIGDSMNLVASLFSGLAFVGLIFTLLLQKQELQDNREELARQANETENLVRMNSISNQLSFWQEALAMSSITKAEEINNIRMPYFRMLKKLDPEFGQYMNQYGGYSKENNDRPDDAVKEVILDRIAVLVRELELLSKNDQQQ